MADPTPAPGAAAPRCYRHPDRPTYVRCSRCERPICPDCMIDAPVGFHCPDCVADARRTVPAPRGMAGGRRRSDDTLLTRVLIVVNVVVYVITLLAGDRIIRQYGMAPVAVAQGEWYRLGTAVFLHASLFHLLFNMYALWILGGAVEPRLGRTRFLTVYAGSAIAGSTASFLFSPALVLSVGASGAIFGLFGAVFVVQRKLGMETGGIIALLVINLVLGFTVSGIDWRAHLGGLVAGTALTAAMVHLPRSTRVVVPVVGLLTVLALAGVAVAYRTPIINGCLDGTRPAGQCSGSLTGLG